MTDRPQIDIQKLIGGGYNRFMNSKDMFCVVKGSKGSKKSKTAAIKIVLMLMQYPQANALCIRRVRDTLLDSVYADIGWAIDKLQVNHLWKKSRNPMRYTYRPNDADYQVILFKGMDKAEKLASVTVDHGFLNFVWIEEAFELTNDEEFEKLQMSIRGQLPPGYFKQIIMTFNPWSELSWIKTRFFDRQAPDSFVDTTTFRDNEFLDETDIRRYLDLYETNPRRARVVCDGDWGVSEGLIYENWEIDEFDIDALRTNPDIRILYGLDFGWSAQTAFVACAVDIKHRTIYVFDEWYQTKTTTLDIAKTLIQKGYGHEKIIADCAQPESIFSLRTGNGLTEETATGVVVTYSLPNMAAGIKGADSIDHGIQFLQSFFVHIHPRCRNFIQEISVYAYDTDSDGKSTGKPIDDYNHCLVGDTLVSTSRGHVPIKDIKAGDMVWSHLGLREVTGTLVKEDQPIWEVEFSNGTVLRGTSDHPMITVLGATYLKDLVVGDMVISWTDPTDEWTAKGTYDLAPSKDFTLPASKEMGLTTPDAVTRCMFVKSSIMHACPVGVSDGRPALLSVVRISQSATRDTVCDITVDEAYDFFANDVFVGDCMDAWRYAVTKEYLESGNGYVAEAGGVSGMGKYEKEVDLNKPDDKTVQVFARRVFSTSLDD